jgi:hypothetical protein
MISQVLKGFNFRRFGASANKKSRFVAEKNKRGQSS